MSRKMIETYNNTSCCKFLRNSRVIGNCRQAGSEMYILILFYNKNFNQDDNR